LHESLINQYPSVTFPVTSYQFAKVTGASIIGGAGLASRASNPSEDRRKTLQAYLQELALIPAIKESS
jgi:hypothetical protein